MKRKTLIYFGIVIALITMAAARHYTQDYNNWLTRGDINTDTFHVYFNHSHYQSVDYNLTESKDDTVHIYPVAGEKFVFGGELI